MSCFTKIDVCNCTGAEIDLIAPENGNYTLTFRYLNRKLTYNQIVTSGSKFTNPTAFNEDATVSMTIKDSGGDAVAIGGVYTFLLNFVSCNNYTAENEENPMILEYFIDDYTDTELSLQGVDIDGTVLNFPYTGDAYYVEVFLNGSKLSVEDYIFNPVTGLITFTVTTNHDNIIVKLTKKI
jgi:hypothetical protein